MPLDDIRDFRFAFPNSSRALRALRVQEVEALMALAKSRAEHYA